jgi:two-component system cell cycle sensor histidine kinase/response regulator CckA
MTDKDDKIEKLERRITGLEKTLQIVAGHSGRTEKNLRQLFDIVANTLPVPLVISSESGRILFSNQSSQEIYGYSDTDFERIKVMDLYENPGDRQKLLDVLTETDVVKDFSVNMRKADGSIFPVSHFSRLIDFENQKCVLTVTYDLSDLRREEKRRLALEKQLRHTQKMEAIGIMAGGIAHDFNNLLHVINGYCQVLLSKETEHSAAYDELKQIECASSRAAALIKQLLTFSRKAETNRKPMDLNREVKLAGKILDRTLPKMIAIHLQLASDLDRIEADPVQIEQIVLNMGSNAADAMPGGGNLTIGTQNVRLDDRLCAELPGVKPGEYVRLTIADNGHGMDIETQQQIFDPFFTTKQLGKGTGLGLASVYGIVKNHGGHIACHSQPGRGTRFDIHFPAIRHAAATRKDQTKAPPIESGCETILVVDDEETIRDLATQVFKHHGYGVMTAASGEAAVAIYAEEGPRIDLVILDLGMPGMGGHKCLVELLRIDPEAKVIIASGYAMDQDVRKSMDAGAAGFIGKPFQLADLMARVRDTLGSPTRR